MSKINFKILNKLIISFLTLLATICMTDCSQPVIDEIDQSIAEIRKGQLCVKANKGELITIEQVRHQFWFGCAITERAFNDSMSERDSKQYEAKFLENFNAAVTGNALKWKHMERERGNVDYSNVEAILAWTTKNELPLRGHCIFWGTIDGNVVPNIQPWVMALNDQELEETVRNRAQTIATRYKDRFAEYDLNNEMIHGNYYEDRLGPEITKRMVEWVHSMDPGAQLFLNDYDITTGRKLPEYMAHIRTLLGQGVRIAGIGVQGHLHAETFDRDELKKSLDSLAQFNLPVRITEFNMPGQRSKYLRDRNLKMTAEEEAQNAKELVDFFRICFAHPTVTGIMMWGFCERDNWIPVSSLYRSDWTITPTGEAYRNLVFKDWWTKASGKANRKGIFSTSAFYGKYIITAGNVTRIVDFTPSSGNVVVDLTTMQ